MVLKVITSLQIEDLVSVHNSVIFLPVALFQQSLSYLLHVLIPFVKTKQSKMSTLCHLNGLVTVVGSQEYL